MDILQADLSVLPAAQLTELATWLRNAIQMRIAGTLPEAAEESVVAGLQIRRTTLKDLIELAASVARAQAIQAASVGGLNIISSSRRDSGGGMFGRRRSSFS